MKDMKRIKRSLLKTVSFLGCLFVFLSCTSGEQEMPMPGEPQPLEITAEIDPQTRAAVDASNYDKHSFAANDQITVTNTTSTSTTANYYYNGTRWLPVSGTGITTSGGDSFTASYPTSFTAIQAIQNSYENFWKSNKLVSTATASGNLVKFNFAPAAAKITVVVEYQESLSCEYIKVKGATVLTASGPDTEEITLLGLVTTGTRHTYVGIINPGTKTYTITVKAQNKTAQSYTQSSKGLLAGHNYIYNFSSTSYLILNSVSVEDFHDQPEIPGGDAT